MVLLNLANSQLLTSDFKEIFNQFSTFEISQCWKWLEKVSHSSMLPGIGGGGGKNSGNSGKLSKLCGGPGPGPSSNCSNIMECLWYLSSANWSYGVQSSRRSLSVLSVIFWLHSHCTMVLSTSLFAPIDYVINICPVTHYGIVDCLVVWPLLSSATCTSLDTVHLYTPAYNHLVSSLLLCLLSLSLFVVSKVWQCLGL